MIDWPSTYARSSSSSLLNNKPTALHLSPVLQQMNISSLIRFSAFKDKFQNALDLEICLVIGVARFELQVGSF